jgi:hypothetical protein
MNFTLDTFLEPVWAAVSVASTQVLSSLSQGRRADCPSQNHWVRIWDLQLKYGSQLTSKTLVSDPVTLHSRVQVRIGGGSVSSGLGTM